MDLCGRCYYQHSSRFPGALFSVPFDARLIAGRALSSEQQQQAAAVSSKQQHAAAASSSSKQQQQAASSSLVRFCTCDLYMMLLRASGHLWILSSCHTVHATTVLCESDDVHCKPSSCSSAAQALSPPKVASISSCSAPTAASGGRGSLR